MTVRAKYPPSITASWTAINTTIPWFEPRMTGYEAGHISAVLESGFVNDGTQTRQFERRIAEMVGRRRAVAVPNGTLAIAAALMACGAGPGDNVIVPDLTFIATANAARLTGAGVVLADVNPRTMCLTPDTVDRARARSSFHARFVVAVEVNGRSPDYAELGAYCVANRLTLITDSCEALGSDPDGKPLGSYGAASCLSFSPNKIITTGQGGMVLTDDDGIFERLLLLKYQGLPGRGTGGGADNHAAFGINLKFTDIQAAMGLAQIGSLADRLEAIANRDRWYFQALAGAPIEIPDSEHGSVCLWFDVLADRRDDMAERLDAAGIGARPFWRPLHTQKPYEAAGADFPGATAVAGRGLWLPSGPSITLDDVSRVAAVIKRV